MTFPHRVFHLFQDLQSSENPRDLIADGACNLLAAAPPPSSKSDLALASYCQPTWPTLGALPAAIPTRRDHRSDRTCLQVTERIQNYDLPCGLYRPREPKPRRESCPTCRPAQDPQGSEDPRNPTIGSTCDLLIATPPAASLTRRRHCVAA